MKKYTRIFVLMLLMAAALALSVWADEGAVLSVSSAQANAGDTVTLELTLDNNPGVAAVSVYLDYDAAKLRPVSYEISREANQRFMISLANESAGSVMMVALKDVDYSGVIAELAFEVLADAVGEAEVSISDADLANFNDEVVACRSESGIVSIANDGTAAPEDDEEATESGGEATESAPENATQGGESAETPAENPQPQTVEDDSEWLQESIARFEEEVGAEAVTAEAVEPENAETAEPESAETLDGAAPEATTAPRESKSEASRWPLIIAALLLVLAAAVVVVFVMLRKKDKAARH